MEGRARSEVEVVDLSVLANTRDKGISAVLGVTQWGDVDKPVLVNDWSEFLLHFGGFDKDFKVPVDTNFPLLCYRALQAGAKLLVSRVGHHLEDGSIEGTKPTAVVGNGTFTGKYIGNYEVSIKVVVETVAEQTTVFLTEEPISGDSGKQFARTIEVPEKPTDSEIEYINSMLRFCTLDGVTADGFVEASGNVTGGTQVVANIVDADYIGVLDDATGIHAFDELEFSYIALPDLAKPALDLELANYVDTRKDCIAILRTPVGIDASLILDYRNQEGGYVTTGGPVDTWRARMYTGGLKIQHPVDKEVVEISAIGDILGLLAVKDTENFEWLTAAGYTRGLITNALGVAYNLGNPGNAKLADKVDNAGVNAIISTKANGVVVWGNSTLQIKYTMLKHANVADLIMLLQKSIKTITDKSLFEPNDIVTWKHIFRSVKTYMDFVKGNRGVLDYKYDGDQDVSDISECVVNKPEDIDKGMYVFNLWVKPIVGLKYIYIPIKVTNSSVEFGDVVNN